MKLQLFGVTVTNLRTPMFIVLAVPVVKILSQDQCSIDTGDCKIP